MVPFTRFKKTIRMSVITAVLETMLCFKFLQVKLHHDSALLLPMRCFLVLDLVVHSLACHSKFAFWLLTDATLLIVVSCKKQDIVMVSVGELVSMLGIKESLLVRTVEPHSDNVFEPENIWKGKSADHMHKCVIFWEGVRIFLLLICFILNSVIVEFLNESSRSMASPTDWRFLTLMLIDAPFTVVIDKERNVLVLNHHLNLSETTFLILIFWLSVRIFRGYVAQTS